MTKENRSWGIPLSKVGDAHHLTYGVNHRFFLSLLGCSGQYATLH